MAKLNNNNLVRWLIHLVSGRLKIMRACSSTKYSGLKLNILCDQLMDSMIIAGITGVSAYVYAGQNTSLNTAVLSFILTFLIKMKEYRKIS